jgi:hypothetical protein
MNGQAAAPMPAHPGAAAAARTAILHIGVIKTGSTAVQRYLEQGRGALYAKGVAYPRSIGTHNHQALAMALRDATAGADGSSKAALNGLLDKLAIELRALPAGVGRVILSSEHFFGLNDDAVALLRESLAPHFAAFRILVYLRRQDEFVVSRHANMIRSGHKVAGPLTIPPPDYAKLMSRWAAVFGEAALMPRIFDPASMPGGNVVADALAALDLTGLPGLPAERANPNLRPEALQLLRLFTDFAEREGLADAAPIRNRLAAMLQARAQGHGMLPSRAEAAAFVAKCARSNEAVRARWFASRPSLFSTDFSAYPETPPPTPDVSDALDVAFRLLADLPEGRGRAG